MNAWVCARKGGCKVGVANPALFHRGDDCSRGEFTEMTLLWWAHVVRWTRWARPCLVSIACENAELLNRIVSVGTDSDGRRYVRIEPDIRHAVLVLNDFGLEGSKAKPLTTPGSRSMRKNLRVERRRGSVGF